jgi:hypothetical protein
LTAVAAVAAVAAAAAVVAAAAAAVVMTVAVDSARPEVVRVWEDASYLCPVRT